MEILLARMLGMRFGVQRLPRRVLKHVVGHTIDGDIVNSAFVILCLPQSYCRHDMFGYMDRDALQACVFEAFVSRSGMTNKSMPARVSIGHD